MTTALPWMKFWVNDWLSSPRVTAMTAEQRGAYIQLIAFCWASGDASLPDDDETLAKLSGMNEGWLKGGCHLVRVCFEPHPLKPGKLTQRRVYEEWQKQLQWIEKSKKGGRKSGITRKLRKSKGGSTTLEPPYEPNANQTSTNGSGSGSISGSPSSVKQKTNSPSCAATCSAIDVDQVIGHYKSYHPRARPGKRERHLIAQRLTEDQYAVSDLLAAIDGCHKSPHHCGQNERNTKYQSLELIVRDSKHVQQFIEFAVGDGTAFQGKNQALYDHLMEKYADDDGQPAENGSDTGVG